jgi:hypothetical protein
MHTIPAAVFTTLHRADNISLTVDLPAGNTSSNASEAVPSPESSGFQYHVEHTAKPHVALQPGFNPLTSVTTTGFLSPSEESLKENGGQVPLMPGGFKSARVLRSDGSLAAVSTESLLQLYLSDMVGPDDAAKFVSMRNVFRAGDPTLLPSSMSR